MDNYGVFNDIALATLSARRNEIMNNTVNRECQTMMFLEQNVQYASGDKIDVKFRKDKMPAGSYEGAEERPVDSPPLYAGGKIDWKENDVTVALTERDMVTNIGLNIQDILKMNSIRSMSRGDAQTMYDLFQGYYEAAIMDFKEEICRQVMLSDGLNTKSGNYTDIEGFPVVFDKGESYADLDPGDKRIGVFDAESIVSGVKDPIWDIKQLDLNNEREVTQLDLTNLASDCYQYGQRGKLYVAVSSRHYNAFEYTFEGDKVRQDMTAVRMGFERNMYIPRLGITIYEETFLKGDHENTMYGWQPRHMHIVKHRALDMEFSGAMVQIDRNRVVYRFKSMMNLRCRWRAGMFRILNALPGDNF